MKYKFAVLFVCIPLFSFALAGLEIQSLAAVVNPAGTQINLKLNWINHGPEEAGNPACNIYVYSVGRLVLSQNLVLKPLPAGSSREEVFEIQVPAGTTVTNVKAEIFDSQQADNQPSNNLAQVNIKPPQLRNADLEIVEASVETEQPVKGKSAILNVHLRNRGPEPVKNSKFTAELLLFASAVAKGERRMGRLDSGEETQIKLAVPLSDTIITATTGLLQLSWQVLNPDMTDPAQENNSFELPVALVLRMPDLLPQAVNIDRRGVLRFSVMNKGNARSPASITALYINGALTRRYETTALQSGGSQKFEYRAPEVATGTKISIVADFNADVEEFSEENNRLNYR